MRLPTVQEIMCSTPGLAKVFWSQRIGMVPWSPCIAPVKIWQLFFRPVRSGKRKSGLLRTLIGPPEQPFMAFDKDLKPV